MIEIKVMFIFRSDLPKSNPFFSLRAKMVDVPLALNFTQFLYNETAYLPWESAVRNLKYFVLMFDRSEVYGPMQVSVIVILKMDFIDCVKLIINSSPALLYY